MQPFDYARLPLRNEEIRILELLPAASPDDPITTQIFKADLRDLPSLSVSALSYCWGDIHGRGPVEITVGTDNDTLSITASLAMALRALRCTDRPARLWIDQICINQGDDEEKSRQIPLMGRIYSLSSETIGWLGEAASNSDLAMEYLQRVGIRAHSLGLSSLDENTLQVLLSDEGDVDSGILAITRAVPQVRKSVQDMISEQGNLLELPALEGMVQLAVLPYFRRGWIQQEVAIPSNLRLHWGDKTIGPDHFAAGVWFHHIWTVRSITSLATPEVYEDPAARALLERILSPSARLIDHVIPSLTTRGWYHSSDTALRGKLTMAGLLRRLKSVQFTEPRDRIYGILGLAMDKTRPTFAVDTTKKWEEVFTDVSHGQRISPVDYGQLDQIRPKIVLSYSSRHFGAIEDYYLELRLLAPSGPRQVPRCVKTAIFPPKLWQLEYPVLHDATGYIVMHGDWNENATSPSDGINFLSLVSFPKKNGSDALPSWVPDLMDVGALSTLSRDTGALSPPYRAGGSPGPRSILTGKENDEDPRILAVRGVILDKIIELGPAWEDDDSEDSNQPRDINPGGLAPLSFMSSLASKSHTIVSSNPNSKHPFRSNFERLLEAEWRVPVLNRESVASTSASRSATLLSKKGHEKAKYIMLFDKTLKLKDPYKILSDVPLSEEETAELDAKHGPPNSETNPDKNKRLVAEIQLKMSKAVQYRNSKEYRTYTALLDAFEKRRAFLTEEGYVGVGPVGMREGDIVVVLFGASFPFVLREKEKEKKGYYELVGEAYCDGVMDGEAMGMELVGREFLLE